MSAGRTVELEKVLLVQNGSLGPYWDFEGRSDVVRSAVRLNEVGTCGWFDVAKVLRAEIPRMVRGNAALPRPLEAAATHLHDDDMFIVAIGRCEGLQEVRECDAVVKFMGYAWWCVLGNVQELGPHL